MVSLGSEVIDHSPIKDQSNESLSTLLKKRLEDIAANPILAVRFDSVAETLAGEVYDSSNANLTVPEKLLVIAQKYFGYYESTPVQPKEVRHPVGEPIPVNFLQFDYNIKTTPGGQTRVYRFNIEVEKYKNNPVLDIQIDGKDVAIIPCRQIPAFTEDSREDDIRIITDLLCYIQKMIYNYFETLLRSPPPTPGQQ